MLGMHPIFTLFGTSPDMTTAAGAANYARQLTTEAGLAVMLAQPGKKLPWDTRTVKERENDQVYWDELRANNPERNLPEEMGGFYLASKDPARVGKLIRAGYKILEGELAERDYYRTRRDMVKWAAEGTSGTADPSLTNERRNELAAALQQAHTDVQELSGADGKEPRKGTKKHAQYTQALKLTQAEPLSGDEQARLDNIESSYPTEFPNLAVEVGASNVVVADCDTADEVAWFKEWAAEQSGDSNWQFTMPTVLSPGVFAEGEWKHRDGGHFWFSINADDKTPTPAGLTVQPIPETITKVHVKKPGTDVQFTLMVNKAYVLIPPSARAEGAYKAAGPSHDMPGWLYDYIIKDHQDQQERQEARERERALRSGLDDEQQEAVEQWWTSVSWADILIPHGWRPFGTDNCGCPVFSRPGYTNPKSATGHILTCTNPRYSDSNDPPIHFWTDNPGDAIQTMIAQVGSASTLSKLQLVAALDYGCDIRAALSGAVQMEFNAATTYDVTQAAPGFAMVDTVEHDEDEDDAYNASAYLSGPAPQQQPSAQPAAQPARAPQPATASATPSEAQPGNPAPAPHPAAQPAQPAQPAQAPALPPVPEAFVPMDYTDDDETYEATAEEEEELPPPALPEAKQDIKVYKTSGITDDKITLRSLDYLRKHRPPVKFLIRDWIQENTVSLIVGPSNSGKSAVVLDMLCTMAAESSPYESDHTMWVNQKAKRRNILYIAGEGIDGVTNRVAAWEEQHGRQVGKHMIFKEEAFKFQSPESSWYRLGESIINNNIDVVVFDTLAMMMTGMEENSNDDMGQVVAWLQNLQVNTGATIILIHHTTKSTENVTPRGASALTGAVASQVLVQKRDMETLDEDTRERFKSEYITPIRVSVTKQKDGKYPDDLDLTLVPVPVPPRLDEDGNELPNVDDFGDENYSTTVLLGDSTGRVVTSGSAPSVEFAKPSKNREVPADFTGRVLEALIDRIVIVTTGERRSRRVVDASRARLYQFLKLDMDYYQYGADETDLKRSFETALNIAFREGLVEYEGTYIIPAHNLGLDRNDRDAVREELMRRIADEIAVDSYVADEGDTGGDGDGGPDSGPDGPDTGLAPAGLAAAAGQIKVPTHIAGKPVGQASAELIRSVRPDPMPQGESRRGAIPMDFATVAVPSQVMQGQSHQQQDQRPPAPTAQVSAPTVLPGGVTAKAPQPGGFSAVVPDVSGEQTTHPTPPQQPALVSQPVVPNAVPASNPENIPARVQAPVPPAVQRPVPPSVTPVPQVPATQPVPPAVPNGVQPGVRDGVQGGDIQNAQTSSSTSEDIWGDYTPGFGVLPGW